MAGHICRLDGLRRARRDFEGDISGRRPAGKAKDCRTDGVTRHARKLAGTAGWTDRGIWERKTDKW